MREQSGWWPTTTTVSPRSCDSRAHVLGGCPGGEPLVGLGLDARGSGELPRRLSGAQQRARQDRVGTDALVGKTLRRVRGRPRDPAR